MKVNIKIRVGRGGGWVEVEGKKTVIPELAITPYEPFVPAVAHMDAWVITHIPSGRRLSVYPLRLAEAREAVRLLRGLRIPWKRITAKSAKKFGREFRGKYPKRLVEIMAGR